MPRLKLFQTHTNFHESPAIRKVEMADPAPSVDPPIRHASPSPSNGTISHRSSFAENLRHSPRSQRHPSFTQAAVQELLNHPPAARTGDPRFVGRDWRQIHIGELVQESDVRWAELDTGVEQATNVHVPKTFQDSNTNSIAVLDPSWTSKRYPITRARD